MREFSKIRTTLWKSRRVRAMGDCTLTPRLLFLYLLANEHGNSCGCFDLDPLYVCADLQCSKDDFDRCLKALCEVSLIHWDIETNTVLISKWEDENAPTNPKHAIGLFAHMENISSDPLRAMCFEIYCKVISDLKLDREASVRAAIERAKRGLSEYYETLDPPKTQTRDPDQRPETQTETKTRPDLDLRENAQTPLRSVARQDGNGLSAVSDDDPAILYDQLLQEANAKSPTASRLLQTPLMKRAAS